LLFRFPLPGLVLFPTPYSCGKTTAALMFPVVEKVEESHFDLCEQLATVVDKHLGERMKYFR